MRPYDVRANQKNPKQFNRNPTIVAVSVRACVVFLNKMETNMLADFAGFISKFCCIQTLAALRQTDTAGIHFQVRLDQEFVAYIGTPEALLLSR